MKLGLNGVWEGGEGVRLEMNRKVQIRRLNKLLSIYADAGGQLFAPLPNSDPVAQWP